MDKYIKYPNYQQQQNNNMHGESIKNEDFNDQKIYRKNYYDHYGKIQEQNVQYESKIEQQEYSVDIQASLKGSQIQSINEYVREECNPMILSQNEHMKGNLDKMLILRMRNIVSELRQKYLEIIQYIEDQRIIMEEYVIEIIKSIHTQIDKFSQKQKLQNTKNPPTIPATQDSKDKLYEIYAKEQIIKQLQQNIKLINQNNTKLTSYNESLQEYIFDMQQRIVGIDLQVQKKVKEKSKGMVMRQHTQVNESLVKEDGLMIQQLKEQIQSLQRKTKYYDNLLSRQSQIKQSQLKLSDERTIIQRQKEEMLDLKYKLQKLKGENYQRQHEILIAEQNLSKKIFEVRKKETQLSLWESQLTKKASQAQKLQNQQMNHRPYNNQTAYNNNTRNYEDLNYQFGKESDEISLKSFGKNNNNNSNQTEFIMMSPKTQEEFILSSAYKKQAQSPPNLSSHYRTKEIIKEIKDNSIYRSQNGRQNGRMQTYTEPNINNQQQVYTNKYVQRDRDFSSPYNHIKDTINNISKNKPYNPQNNGRTNSPHNHYREQSKNSRSSAAKSIKGYPINKSILSKPISDPKLNGIGSKLQRLRQQIKKQIDSIK